MSFVVDNSVAITWCIEDELTPATKALLDQVTATGASAPQLWPLEALNSLMTAERRGRITAQQRRRLVGFLEQLPINIDAETASRVWGATAQLAEHYRLTAYDAAYLELALRLGLPLGTRDKALAGAAHAAGVTVLPAE